jgi:hypothetical protein
MTSPNLLGWSIFSHYPMSDLEEVNCQLDQGDEERPRHEALNAMDGSILTWAPPYHHESWHCFGG